MQFICPVLSPSLSLVILVSPQRAPPQSAENIKTTYCNALTYVVLIFHLYFQVREWAIPQFSFPATHDTSLALIPSTSQFKDVINVTFPLYLISYIHFSYFLNFSAFPCALIRRFYVCANFCFGFLTEIVSKVCTTKVVGRYIFVWVCILFISWLVLVLCRYVPL